MQRCQAWLRNAESGSASNGEVPRPTLGLVRLTPTERRRTRRVRRDVANQGSTMIAIWKTAWGEFVPFLEFPVELRRDRLHDGWHCQSFVVRRWGCQV